MREEYEIFLEETKHMIKSFKDNANFSVNSCSDSFLYTIYEEQLKNKVDTILNTTGFLESYFKNYFEILVSEIENKNYCMQTSFINNPDSLKLKQQRWYIIINKDYKEHMYDINQIQQLIVNGDAIVLDKKAKTQRIQLLDYELNYYFDINRFSYIKDFVERLAVLRFEKDSLEITEEEIQIILNSVIDEYKNKKTL